MLRQILAVCKKEIKQKLPPAILDCYFQLFPFIGHIIFNYPSRRLKVIGITGTDGKSSTVIFLARILKKAGWKVGFSSSVFINDGNREYFNNKKMTMPGRFFMQKFINRLVKNKCSCAIIEVTSEGIKQKRHLYIDFDVAIITNIKPEHIESHGGFENYKNTKASFFRSLSASFPKNIPKTIIANNNDLEAKSFLKFPARQKISFGRRYSNSQIEFEIIDSNLEKNIIRIFAEKENFIINLKLGGPFVAINAAAAISAAKSLGIKNEICRQALEEIKLVSGRFEIISRNPLIIIDYAHTIAAVSQLLEFTRTQWPGKIIHVFGAAGGGRDKWKRPKLGEISEKFTDISILTEENSFDEKTEKILEDIKQGFQDKNRVLVIPQRKKALEKALELSDKNTLILSTGKGCETVMASVFGKKIPYNEKETLLCLLNKLFPEF